MKRVFLRLWGLAVGLFLVGLLAHEAIVWFLWSPEEVAYWQQFYAPSYAHLAEELAAEDDPAAALREAERAFGVAVALEPLSALPPAPRARLEAGEDMVWVPSPDGDLNYLALPGRPQALRVGPYAPYPMPDLRARLALLLCAAGLFGGSFWWILRPLDRSQRAVARAAAQLAEGALDTRLSDAEAQAAPQIAGAFNHMAGEVQRLVVSQREILSAASHELRTPIARLRVGAHLLSPAPEAAAGLERDLDELEELVDELLTHARLEIGAVEPAPAPVRLGPVVDGLLEAQGLLSPELLLTLDEAIWDAPPLLAVPALLERALRNLISNGARYAASELRVSTAPAPGGLDLLIDDDGPGLPEADRARALLPFIRLDEKSGHGMGLAIVTRIATWHGGALTLERSPLGGCRARLRWPIPPA